MRGLVKRCLLAVKEPEKIWPQKRVRKGVVAEKQRNATQHNAVQSIALQRSALLGGLLTGYKMPAVSWRRKPV